MLNQVGMSVALRVQSTPSLAEINAVMAEVWVNFSAQRLLNDH